MYLLVIEVIKCTQPDHHTETETLIHCITLGIIPMHVRRRTAHFYLHTRGRGRVCMNLCMFTETIISIQRHTSDNEHKLSVLTSPSLPLTIL